MLVVADTHVHVYDCHDLNEVFSSAFHNLAGLTPRDEKSGEVFSALFLTERQGCRFFQKLKSGALQPVGSDYTVEQCSEDNVLRVRSRPGESLYLFAGRQIVTCERIEVLALTADIDIPDGGNILDVIKQVLSGGGVPVLPWAPGKWFGRRGEIISSALDLVSPGQVLVGDTSMRPPGWRVPRLMKEAAEKGFKIVAGTDPFPFAGQERLVGRYGISFDSDFDVKRPVSEMRRLLTDSGIKISPAGRRDSLFAVARRILLNSLKKAG